MANNFYGLLDTKSESKSSEFVKIHCCPSPASVGCGRNQPRFRDPEVLHFVIFYEIFETNAAKTPLNPEIPANCYAIKNVQCLPPNSYDKKFKKP